MANTTFRLTASKADTPISGDNPSVNPASTPGESNSPNTGFLTQDGKVNKDVLGVVTSPIVSGAFIFTSFILLLALIAKIKKNKQANFKDSLNKKHYTTRILAFATFLLFAAGVGGTISRFMGVEAETEVESLTTSGTVDASLIEVTDNYKLYCGTDNLTLDQESVPYGNLLFMYADNDGILPTTTSGITNIASAESWDGLGIGEWGYYVGDYSADAITNPMPLGYSIISNEAESTLNTAIPVTYCAKISKNIEAAEYSATIEYELMPRGEGDIYPELDFNSADDDDADGLSNREENRYGMNPLSADSDMDSLSDYDELKVHHTDPLVEDTDEDGLADYSEVALSKADQYNFDPNTPDYNGGSLTYSGEVGGNSNITYTVTGTGDIPLTYIEPTNPVDVEESLGSTGTAYTLQSAGEITGGEIVAPYTTETTDQGDDDTLGAADLSDDDLTGSEITATVLTFNEDNEEDGFIPADITYPESTIDSANRTITMPITGSQQIIIVGNANDDDETLGASLLSKVVSKIKTSKVVQAITTFVNNIQDASKIRSCTKNGSEWDETSRSCKTQEQIACEKNNKVWDYTTKQCKTKEQATCEANSLIWDSSRDNCKHALAWQVSNGFVVGRDSIRTQNTHGYYDEEGQYEREDKIYYTGGTCFAIALLSRLLYLNKIDLYKEHNIILKSDSDRFPIRSFSLSEFNGDKTSILKSGGIVQKQRETWWGNINNKTTENVTLNTGTLGKTLYVLQKWNEYQVVFAKNKTLRELWSTKECIDTNKYSAKCQTPEINIYDGPDIFIETIKNKISKDDPIILGAEVRNDNGHAVNAISMGLIYEKNSKSKRYELDIYDNNYPFWTKVWEMECSMTACAFTKTTSMPSGNIYAKHTYLENDNYFLEY